MQLIKIDKMPYARITGTGSSLPEKVVTNSDLYGMPSIRDNFDVKAERAKSGATDLNDAEIFDNWVQRVSGVKERRYVTKETTEKMAADASNKALKAAGISAKDLDRIYVETFTPSSFIDNAGGLVGELIGARGIPVEQSTTACASFLYSLEKAYNGITAGTYENVLIVAAESLSRVTDWEDPKTTILWGDGAGAAVVQASDEPGLFSVPYLDSYHSTNIEFKNPLMLEEFAKTMISMKGENVFEAAVEAFVRDCFGALLYYEDYGIGKIYMRKNRDKLEERSYVQQEFKELGLDALLKKLIEEEDLMVILHQANERIERTAAKRMGIPYDRLYITINKFANTSGASIPMALDDAIRNGIINKGQLLMFLAVGGCYPSGGVILRL